LRVFFAHRAGALALLRIGPQTREAIAAAGPFRSSRVMDITQGPASD
jgi:hypothetical protein